MTTAEPTAPSLPPEAAATQLLFQIGTGYMASAALQTVLKLGIADHMSAAPTSVANLARKASVNEDALYRVMRALASLGIFDEVSPRRFALTLAGRMLQKTDSSFYNMGLWITSPFHFRVYANMLHAVTTGQPGVEKVTGIPIFEYFAQPENRELSEIFNNAMSGFSAQAGPAALEAYDFSGIGTLVDVAGGHGMLLTSILQKYREMRGILFDLPHVIAGATAVIEAAGVKDRCATMSGDFFKDVPDGDAYLMKHILHDWNDERAAQILRNIRRHLAGKSPGRVILLEAVLQPGNQADLGKMIDLEMLMMPGGKERSEAEFAALFKSTGFALTRVVPTKSPLSIIEAKVA
jgi:hypothetical protein